MMETLGGFPSLPALWLRRAKPVYAYAFVISYLGRGHFFGEVDVYANHVGLSGR